MVEKRYQWADGATLDDHSRRKHKILREYFFKYLAVRCQIPQQAKFRLAVIDGFAGGGRYKCGAAGSPIIFVEELKNAVAAVNLERAAQGLGAIEIECLLLLNDESQEAINTLKSNVTPLLAEIKENHDKLNLQVEYLNHPFEVAYPTVKKYLSQGSYRNVIFNLDQCGHSHVAHGTILDIMRSYPSAEIFYTFAVESLLAFLRKSEPEAFAKQLGAVGVDDKALESLQGTLNNYAWLGVAERLVFEVYKNCAPFVSPFSINNPNGWRYWLIHFANNYRARQVYNNILHDNSSSQAHFGRSGLNMLAYDPSHEEGSLYLFGDNDRAVAKGQLLEDIPRLVSESGDAVLIGDFYAGIYNATPAHADDVHAAMIENPDIEVITANGGERRKGNTIVVGDVIKIKKQRSFFPVFLDSDKPQ
ncbi:three-Cys-motif partner protein TcmP [Parasphingorhabdus sp.]|uniref:three-Cys-motif partner protein TcmP n=1 Tax=Parasphingorhabdus sp. TaxID=2709688 RepID=UPI003A8D9D74